jgi:Concanavalin A-like lectin/glucanases superfamily
VSAYSTAVLADAPTHYWRCADPGGRLLHDIGSTPRVLTLGTSPDCTPYSGPVSDGGSAQFEQVSGADNFDTELNGAPATIECWFWQVHRRGVIQGVFDCDQVGVTTILRVGMNATGHVVCNVALSNFISPGVMSTQAWHHLAATRTGVLTTLYVDGVAVNTLASGAQGPVSTAFELGGDTGASLGNPTSFCSGAIAEAAFYQTALSAARIAAHFAAADNVASRPVYLANGIFTLSSGALVTDNALLTDIHKYVSQTYQNAV